MADLTPYDRGERLQPMRWVTPRGEVDHPDADFGKVDFDNEEGGTNLTLWVERNEDGTYTLHGYTTVKLKIEIKEE